jgi:1-deoxy-D-xylulose-5-phosphate synthase
VHKLLTGRLDRFGMLRQRGACPDTPAVPESEHDLVENCHASDDL